MRLVIAASTLAIALSTSVVPSTASEKDDLLVKGAVEMTAAEVAASKIGKTIKGKYVPKQMLWQNEYKADGIKISSFGGKSFERVWSYDGNKWCETAGGYLNCDIVTYKLEDQCYIFGISGNTEHKFKCD